MPIGARLVLPSLPHLRISPSRSPDSTTRFFSPSSPFLARSGMTYGHGVPRIRKLAFGRLPPRLVPAPTYKLVTKADSVSSGEGENEESWPVDEAHTEDEQDAASSNFAPRGASRFQDRVRNKLPKPLDLKNTRQGVAVEKLYSACSVRLFAPIAWFRLRI